MKIDSYFKKNDYKQCHFEATIYSKAHRDKLLIIALYVDDMIFIDNNQMLIDEFKWVMKLEFEMTNFGMMIKQEKREYLYIKEHTSEKFFKS
jgi:Reverse transcriptase (RNA-dependent DNA polymerase)